MNRERAINAYNKIAEGYAELALALADESPGTGSPATQVSPAAGAGDVPPAPVPALQPLPAAASPSAPAARPRQNNESAFTKCPAHDKPWTEGKFGQYCTSSSEDPEWSNEKGYCRVTPRSAAAWLRQHPQVPA